MKRTLLAWIMVLLLAAMACTAVPPAFFKPLTVASTVTPAFSTLSFSTPLPTMGGPMGTLTAISQLVASPEPDRVPYEIVLRGKPHFIEFHAWW